MIISHKESLVNDLLDHETCTIQNKSEAADLHKQHINVGPGGAGDTLMITVAVNQELEEEAHEEVQKDQDHGPYELKHVKVKVIFLPLLAVQVIITILSERYLRE